MRFYGQKNLQLKIARLSRNRVSRAQRTLNGFNDTFLDPTGLERHRSSCRGRRRANNRSRVLTGRRLTDHLQCTTSLAALCRRNSRPGESVASRCKTFGQMYQSNHLSDSFCSLELHENCPTPQQNVSVRRIHDHTTSAHGQMNMYTNHHLPPQLIDRQLPHHQLSRSIFRFPI